LTIDGGKKSEWIYFFPAAEYSGVGDMEKKASDACKIESITVIGQLPTAVRTFGNGSGATYLRLAVSQ